MSGTLQATLFTYMKATQRFIHDSKQMEVDPADLVEYANRARRVVAMRSQCVRILPPIAGSILSGTVTAQGTGYTNPTVTISQQFAGTLVAGVINVDVVFPP